MESRIVIKWKFAVVFATEIRVSVLLLLLLDVHASGF